MQADFPIMLDACVLANTGVCDLFLRLAETPRMYLPRWSATILDEVKRTQMGKCPPTLTYAAERKLPCEQLLGEKTN